MTVLAFIVGALAAAAFPVAVLLSPLGALNFLVLQWFGVRLCAGFEPRDIPGWGADRINDEQIAGFGGRWWSPVAPPRGVRVSWSLLRWVCPLTGWWSAYRWIAKRGGAS